MKLNPAQTALFETFLSDNPALALLKDDILAAAQMLIECYEKGGKVLTCGNGGSASDAEHIVGELMKGFLLKRPLDENDRKALRIAGAEDTFADGLQKGLPAISLVSQTALMTAYLNDVDSDMVFAQQVFTYGNGNDVLIGLSTSGNSRDVVNAVLAARAKGTKTLCITGEKESRLSDLSDLCLRTPSAATYRVQEYTLPIYHVLCALTELYFFEIGGSVVEGGPLSQFSAR